MHVARIAVAQGDVRGCPGVVLRTSELCGKREAVYKDAHSEASVTAAGSLVPRASIEGWLRVQGAENALACTPELLSKAFHN